MDPWALAALDALAEHYARQYGDTGIVTAQRRDALLAEDAAQDTRSASNRAAWQRRQAATASVTEPTR